MGNPRYVFYYVLKENNTKTVAQIEQELEDIFKAYNSLPKDVWGVPYGKEFNKLFDDSSIARIEKVALTDECYDVEVARIKSQENFYRFFDGQ